MNFQIKKHRSGLVFAASVYGGIDFLDILEGLDVLDNLDILEGLDILEFLKAWILLFFE